MRWLPSLSLLTLAGCQFDRPPNVGPTDALIIDAPQVCTPGTRTCAAGRYTECNADGQYVTHLIPNGAPDGSPATITMNAYECPMGCHATQPQCADIDASNGFNAVLNAPEVSATGLDVVLPRTPDVVAGVIVIDTNNYDPVAGETTITDADGTPIRVPAQIITQAGAPQILVLKTRTFSLRAGYVLTLRGDRALGIASHFDVFIAGTLDLVSSGSVVGQACSGRVGLGGTGGGGGGNATPGGIGSTGGVGGAVSDPEPLVGGCDGGIGSIIGGGAIQIASRTRYAMAATALIDVSGYGGISANGISSGGGSGGTAHLQAPTVTFLLGSVVAGRGGSGAAHSPMEAANGLRGPTTGTAGAMSVTCGECGTSGAGATELLPPGSGVGTPAAGAGGGGAVGMCRVRNASGVSVPPDGTLKIGFRADLLRPRSP